MLRVFSVLFRHSLPRFRRLMRSERLTFLMLDLSAHRSWLGFLTPWKAALDREIKRSTQEDEKKAAHWEFSLYLFIKLLRGKQNVSMCFRVKCVECMRKKSGSELFRFLPVVDASCNLFMFHLGSISSFRDTFLLSFSLFSLYLF